MKVKVVETVIVSRVSNEEYLSRLQEKEFLRIADVPHLENTLPYKEPWQIFEDKSGGKLIEAKQSKVMESTSLCLPGAIVVDPLLREAVEKKGMKATDNAMWLLTVALREHTKNILSCSISHKKAVERRKLPSRFIQYPNVLASTGKKDTKSRSHISPSSTNGENGSKKRISGIDIFAAAQGLPAGQIGSLGGTISRISLETSLQSTFNALPPFLPGKDFLDVRNFITKEVFDLASVRKPEISKRQDDSTATSTRVSQSSKDIQNHESTDEQKLQPTNSATLPPGADFKSKPKSAIEDKITVASNTSTSNNQTSLQPSGDADAGAGAEHLAESVVASTKEPPADHPSEGSTKRMGDGGAGAGRGAKNLAALMQRASESKKQGEGDNVKGPSTGTNTASTTNELVSKENQTSTSITSTNDGSEKKLQDNATTNTAKASTSTTTESGTTEGVANANPNTTTTNDTPGSPPPQQQQSSAETTNFSGMGRGIGRGKGFGTKDLAAMRSRVSSKVDDTEE